MDSGICRIKTEYLIADVKTANNPGGKEANENVLKRLTVDDGENGTNDKKIQKVEGKKKNRNRGQNKARPIFKDDRSLNLCHSLLNGPKSTKCERPNCSFEHDFTKYLEEKSKDINEKCYIYSVKGFCPRGLTCRFSKEHIDENLNNIKGEKYREDEPPTTKNGINTDLQIKLRKRDYNFERSVKIVQEFEQQRKEKQKSVNSDPNVDKVSEEKLIGCILDTDEIRESDREKKQIHFRNKLLLSPLTTVGNLPFRRICKEFGADITCGEMACAVPIVKGLTQEWVLTKRHVTEDVFGVQLCGNNAQIVAQAAQLLQENSSVDFIDLNIGCPIDLIYEQGGGSALIRRQNVLEAIVKSCSKLLGDIPFTVKTRTGIYANKSVAHDLVPNLENWGASAVTIHGRSREQRYTKNANWEYIEECAVKAKNIPIIGNGDILNFDDYNDVKVRAPHVSSVMIGRGALIKPWIFKEIKEQKHWDPSSSERFEILKKYVNYGLEHWGSDTKGVENTRRFLLEWQSFLYRYVPVDLLEHPPQKINQRPQKYRGRDDLETLMSSNNCSDWVKLSEMLLGPVPDGFSFVPKHKANSYV